MKLLMSSTLLVHHLIFQNPKDIKNRRNERAKYLASPHRVAGRTWPDPAHLAAYHRAPDATLRLAVQEPARADLDSHAAAYRMIRGELLAQGGRKSGSFPALGTRTHQCTSSTSVAPGSRALSKGNHVSAYNKTYKFRGWRCKGVNKVK